MERVNRSIIVVLLGSVFAYLSIVLMGFAAATSVPANLVEPMFKEYPSLAFAILDLLTIGLPLAFVYFLFVQVTTVIKVNNSIFSSILFSVPFFLVHSYFFILTFPNSDVVVFLASTLPKYMLLACCVWYFSKLLKERHYH